MKPKQCIKSNEYTSTHVVDFVIALPSFSISTTDRLLGTNLLGLGAELIGCDLFSSALENRLLALATLHQTHVEMCRLQPQSLRPVLPALTQQNAHG